MSPSCVYIYNIFYIKVYTMFLFYLESYAVSDPCFSSIRINHSSQMRLTRKNYPSWLIKRGKIWCLACLLFQLPFPLFLALDLVNSRQAL
jgi:hypothetical protein